ncbi:homocysteine S-methyltransferase family protein [uncultured Shimia sp.]|uniref:homocysteine S-methyltransferase family protein n=1 Tax=uncultured Shimia sp. TaxID=573152 RepID=UPI00263526DB|nr:homocysteine S-methyltransferase family protein [uncultured Shimia sp.]
MPKYRDSLPQMGETVFLTYVGMETDLIFTKGVDLPGFASYPLLETEQGRETLRAYLRDLMAVARASGLGVILESATWVANEDRAAPLGYSPDQLVELNKAAIELMAELRQAEGDLPTVISANVGPRDDAYAPSAQMDATEAEAYHETQLATLAETDADLISAYTLAYPAEAIGLVRAARKFALPVIVSFTVETNGRLPTGESLGQAIETVDKATDGYASYFMINCAHPDHLATTLNDAGGMSRVKGIVANASRCSHAELDQATELDSGNPEELGQQLADIRRRHPQISIVGGCCGTDMRHMTHIAKNVG